MDNTFILNPSIDSLGIKDAIHERLTKARSIVSCLMAGNDRIAELHNRFIYGTFWTVDGLLNELEQLQERLEKINEK